MNKRFLNVLIVLVSCVAITSSCKKEDSGVPYTFTSQFVVNNSYLDNPLTIVEKQANQLTKDKYSIDMLFSLDGGATWTTWPKIAPGQKYKVKLYHNNWGIYLNDGDFYVYDWSSSTPKPNSGGNTSSPEFTLGGANNIVVKITDTHCVDFAPTLYTGVWKGDEHGSGVGGTDTNTITQDLVTDPTGNTLVMDNFFGDGVNASIVFTPSTSSQYIDQKITLPKQTTSEGGVASGFGFYDLCRNEFYLQCTYVLGGKTYVWDYNFHK